MLSVDVVLPIPCPCSSPCALHKQSLVTADAVEVEVPGHLVPVPALILLFSLPQSTLRAVTRAGNAGPDVSLPTVIVDVVPVVQ